MRNIFSYISLKAKPVLFFVFFALLVLVTTLLNDKLSGMPFRFVAQVVDAITSTTTATTTVVVVPPNPTTLTATPNVCGSGTIILSWSASDGASGYRLSKNGAIVYDGGALRYTDSSPSGSSHTFSLVAYNSSGSSSQSSITATAPSACPVITIPTAPTGLLVDGAPTSSSVKLVWTDNSTNEDKFNIERKIATATGYSYTVWTLGAGITTFTDTSVVPNTTYDYRVQACLSGTGCSGYTWLYGVVVPPYTAPSGTSTTTSYTNTQATSVPPAPTALVASTGVCGVNSVTLSWQASSGAEGYRIHRNGVLIYTTTNLGYSDTNLTFSTTYQYSVFAYNSAGMSAGAFATGITPTACVANTISIVPSSPTSLYANAQSSTSISLRWTDNANNEDKFNIERKLSTATTYSHLYQVVGSNITTYTDNTVSPGISYDYRVQACLSGSGCSGYTFVSGINTNTLTATTTPPSGTSGTSTSTTTYTATGSGGVQTMTLPSVPISLRANTGSCDIPNIYLSWQASNYASEYKIYRNGVFLNSTTALSFADTNTSSTSNYSYSVYATNVYGTSTPAYINISTPTRCTTTATTTSGLTSASIALNPASATYPPLPPTNLFLNSAPSSTSISLRWTDNANNEDKFNVERKLSTASTFSHLYQIVGSNITTYTDTTVSPGISYDYRVQACLSGSGCSGYAYLSGLVARMPATTTYFTTSTGSTNLPTTTQADTTTKYSSTTSVLPVTTINQLSSNNVTTSAVGLKSTTTIKTVALNDNGLSSTTVAVVLSHVVPETVVQTNTPVQEATTVLSEKVENIGQAVVQIKSVVDDTKFKLLAIINDEVARIVSEKQAAGQNIDIARVNKSRDELIQKIDSSLMALTTITPQEVTTLKNEVNRGIANIRIIAGENIAVGGGGAGGSVAVAATFGVLTETVTNQADILKKQGADLLYKDSNNDGISDYDSVHVYNIDPVKPSPVSTYEGKVINAAEKIVLGFNPVEEKLVKI